MSKDKPEPKSIHEVGRETMDRIIEHMQADTREEDARRQAERDARLKALMEKWRAEGNLPGLTGKEE